MTDFGNGLLVALGIGLLIFVHELGHYLAARFIGARVDVFSLGFGPRLLGFQRGPADYRLSLIPLGGYVAVAGQDPEDMRYPEESLQRKSVGQRFLFFLGGVLMNVLFALVAFPIAFGSGVSFPAPVIGAVMPGSPAWEAGLEPMDRVLAVNGKSMYSFENLVVEVALCGSRPLSLIIERNGEPRTIETTPRYSPQDGIYTIGIEMALSSAPAQLIVAENGAAHAAGLRTGDELVEIDGKPALPTAPVSEETETRAQRGEPIQALVRRKGTDGSDQQILATITPRPTPSERPLLGVEPMRRRIAGIRPGCRLAERLQLQRGDALLAVDGTAWQGQGFAGVGDELVLTVQRAGRTTALRAEANAEDRAALSTALAFDASMDETVIQPAKDSAAAAAGLQAGDRVLEIDGDKVATWPDLQMRVRASNGRALRLLVERTAVAADEAPSAFAVTVEPRRPIQHDYGYTRQIERLRHVVRASDLGDAMKLGSVCAADLVKQLYVTTKRLLTGEVAASNLGGIIQISRVSYHNTQWGLPRFLYFLALLSINLAFVNVLPIPVLDGGHLLFLLIEKIKGSPVSVRVFQYSQVLGLVLVLALVVFVTYNDILRLL
jgi:regulator of sigma E protease